MVTQIDRPPTLGTTVADAIRDAILRTEISPGEALRETQLSDSLGVSRGTIREALLQLQDDGLVEIKPHRGAFVRKLTERTARELYTLRALIEPYAVRLALERGLYSEEDMAELERLSDLVDTLEQECDASYEVVSADVEFHRLMVSRSDHQLLMETFKSLQALTWLFVLNTKLYQSDAYSDEPSHSEVFRAIQGGDPQQAAETLREHIESAGAALLTAMREMKWLKSKTG